MRFSAISCEIAGYLSDIHLKNLGTPILSVRDLFRFADSSCVKVLVSFFVSSRISYRKFVLCTCMYSFRDYDRDV